MNAETYRSQISDLLKKPPKQESIATLSAAVQFKKLALKAQKTGNKSDAKLLAILGELRLYY